ncbi:MAG: hypothetical protein LBT81_03735 [Helicobacteraceae bacterium]|jgi:hypothetical protein|nr:hypothetical protein [Helicobacteraceae bacterium]
MGFGSKVCPALIAAVVLIGCGGGGGGGNGGGGGSLSGHAIATIMSNFPIFREDNSGLTIEKRFAAIQYAVGKSRDAVDGFESSLLSGSFGPAVSGCRYGAYAPNFNYSKQNAARNMLGCASANVPSVHNNDFELYIEVALISAYGSANDVPGQQDFSTAFGLISYPIAVVERGIVVKNDAAFTNAVDSYFNSLKGNGFECYNENAYDNSACYKLVPSLQLMVLVKDNTDGNKSISWTMNAYY